MPANQYPRWFGVGVCLGIYQLLSHQRLVSIVIKATNKAEPMIDQTMGKFVSPIRTENNSGKCIIRASHKPSSAPTNPNAIETKHPPRE